MAMPKLFKDIMDNRRHNVTATSATLVEGSIELVLPISIVTGSIVKFTAPCDASNFTGGLVIDRISYELVDTNHRNINNSKSFIEGSQISVIMDCESEKAYMQNAAVGDIDANNIIHNGSNLSDVLSSQKDKIDLVISTTSEGQTSVINISEESMEDWVCTEGYWNGKYISTGV